MANEDALPSWPSCSRAVECASTLGREPKRLSHTSPSVTRNRRTSTPNSNGVLVVLRKCVGGRWWRHSPDGILIPSWQVSTASSSANCSNTLRNTPDVSANADYTFYVCADQATCTANSHGGTSFAAPMWAGYLALVNQQGASSTGKSVGTIFWPILWTDPVTKVLERILHGQ